MYVHIYCGVSQVTQVVKNLPANAGDIRDSGQEDPLEEGMSTHPSTLAWRIPWTEEPGKLQSTGSQRVGHDWSNLACIHIYCVSCVIIKNNWHLLHSSLQCPKKHSVCIHLLNPPKPCEIDMILNLITNVENKVQKLRNCPRSHK